MADPTEEKYVYTVREFRARLSEALDNADRYAEVLVSRGDKTYSILLEEPNSRVHNPEQARVHTKEDNRLVLKEEPFIPRPPGPDGYPCCSKRTPCKHWQWDYTGERYVNVLTGAFKEPV